VARRPKAITTTAPSPKHTPSSMSPKKAIFRRSRSRTSVILAAVALIQCREAADLLITPSLAHSWLRVLMPACNAVTTAAALLLGVRMGRVAREPVLLLRAIAGQLAHPRPDDRLAAPAAWQVPRSLPARRYAAPGRG
jgi:hypothetical protein